MGQKTGPCKPNVVMWHSLEEICRVIIVHASASNRSARGCNPSTLGLSGDIIGSGIQRVSGLMFAQEPIVTRACMSFSHFHKLPTTCLLSRFLSTSPLRTGNKSRPSAMTTSTPLSYSTSTDSDWENVQSPSTMPNSPAVSSIPSNEPQPSTVICGTRKPKEVSWFRLEILFCDTLVRRNTYDYDPIAARKQKSATATIIFTLDRTLSREQNQAVFLHFIQLSNPRTRMKKETLDKCIDGIAVRRPYEISGPGIMVNVPGLITHLWETETYDLEAVSPDLFGTGGNEVQVLMGSWV